MIDYFILPTISAITVYTFLSIIVVCFFKYGIWSNGLNDRDVQKIIGGLSVFVIAVISQDWKVFMTSLFIGGLIIASEEFMQKLAIIMRSNSKDIGKNLMTTKSTEKEIEEKQKEEVDDVLSQSSVNEKNKSEVGTFIKKIRDSERLLKEYFEKNFGDKFKSEVGVINEAGAKFIADGMISRSGNLPIIVEYKYIRNDRLVMLIIRRTLERIRFILPNNPILICIVTENGFDQMNIKSIEFASKFDNFNYILFKISDNKLLEIASSSRIK